MSKCTIVSRVTREIMRQKIKRQMGKDLEDKEQKTMGSKWSLSSDSTML